MLYLITGGSGSGKSEFAENLAVQLMEEIRQTRETERTKGGDWGLEGRLYYVATMYPYDQESRERIARHRLMRQDKGFVTIECFHDISRIRADKKDVLLVECMSNLLANEMYFQDGRIKDRGSQAYGQMEEAVVRPLLELSERAGALVIVSNEVFSDGVRYDSESELYQALLGKLNAALAKRAVFTAEIVFSIPVKCERNEDFLRLESTQPKKI